MAACTDLLKLFLPRYPPVFFFCLSLPHQPTKHGWCLAKSHHWWKLCCCEPAVWAPFTLSLDGGENKVVSSLCLETVNEAQPVSLRWQQWQKHWILWPQHAFSFLIMICAILISCKRNKRSHPSQNDWHAPLKKKKHRGRGIIIIIPKRKFGNNTW